MQFCNVIKDGGTRDLSIVFTSKGTPELFTALGSKERHEWSLSLRTSRTNLLMLDFRHMTYRSMSIDFCFVI